MVMEDKSRQEKVFDFFEQHDIEYTTYSHPEAPTIEIAKQYWHDDGSKHCKNLFFRNHKGNRHYLVCFDCECAMAIHGLINDEQNHVHLFLDKNLLNYPSLSFHPNDNTATVVISQQMFARYLEAVGNSYEYIELY